MTDEIRPDNIDSAKGGKLFGRFREQVLGDKFPDIVSPSEHLCLQDYKILRIGTVILIALNAFWLFVDALDGGALNLLRGPASVTITLVIFASVIVLAESVRQEKHGIRSVRSAEALLLFYHLCIIAAVTVLKVTKNVTIVENDAVSRYNSIPISAYQLIVVAVTPLPSRRSSLILFFCNLASLLLPIYLLGSEAYSITQNTVFHFSIVIIYASFLKISVELGSTFARVQQTDRVLAYTSYMDSLTGLLNRRAFNEYQMKLERSDSGESVGVFFYDIDSFKSYNDSYTHSQGDKVLETVSTAVAYEFRNDNAYLFRYGGEEFVLITENADEASVRRDGERIRSAVRRAAIHRDDLAGFDIITVTVGCSLENASAARRDLINAADTALYEGKAGTKDCVVFRR